jgi:hypothetical protein
MKLSTKQRIEAVGPLKNSIEEKIFNPSPIDHFFDVPRLKSGKQIELILFLFFSCFLLVLVRHNKKKKKINKNTIIFIKNEGDWLSEHEETPQSVSDLLANPGNIPDSKRNVIYLLPLGNFPLGESPPLLVLREYLQTKLLFIYQFFLFFFLLNSNNTSFFFHFFCFTTLYKECGRCFGL